MQLINVAALQRSVFPRIPSEQRPLSCLHVPCLAHCLPVSLAEILLWLLLYLPQLDSWRSLSTPSMPHQGLILSG